MKQLQPGLLLLAICLLLSGCSVLSITATAVKTTGSVVSTGVKTAGAVVSAPFKMIGGSEAKPDAAAEPVPK